MTNKSPRSQNGKRPRLRLLDINFSSNVNEVLSNGRRPHGGLRGSKKHPLSPYSFNKDEKHHQEVKESINRQFDEDFVDRHGSPGWVVEANREVSHSGENPLYINRLLSPCKIDNDSSYTGSRAVTPTPSGRFSTTPKRSNSMYYRQTTPHQYLSATELPQVSQTDPTPILGRPTRTTLLRARQRCNSAPINAYQKRREVSTKVLPPSNQNVTNISREPTSISLSVEGETNHAFLTGARYNRARLMDVKSLNVYGVYMPRSNPLDCFMTGPGATRLRERSQESPGAPPDSPRSDVEENENTEKDTQLKRPSTAPSKRLLSSSTPIGGRPRSARNDPTSSSINILKDESENKENVNNTLVEKLIYLQNGLFITGRGVIVTLKGFKSPLPQKKGSILPSVTGVQVPKMRYKTSRDLIEESSVINQPPPTPVGQLSIKDETEHINLPEKPKTPILEEITENANTQTQNKEIVNSDTHSKNLEMSVKIIQLSGDPSETVVVYDKTKTGAAEENEVVKQDVLKERLVDSNIDNKTHVDGVKVQEKIPETETSNSEKEVDDIKCKEEEKENSGKSTTFITDKNDDKTTDNKNVISLPNAKLGPDIEK